MRINQTTRSAAGPKHAGTQMYLPISLLPPFVCGVIKCIDAARSAARNCTSSAVNSRKAKKVDRPRLSRIVACAIVCQPLLIHKSPSTRAPTRPTVDPLTDAGSNVRDAPQLPGGNSKRHKRQSVCPREDREASLTAKQTRINSPLSANEVNRWDRAAAPVFGHQRQTNERANVLESNLNGSCLLMQASCSHPSAINSRVTVC